MSTGDDIREVLVEVGSAIHIIHSETGSITSGESIMVNPNAQATKPFIREFFLEAQFPYDTLADEGDIIRFVDTGDTYHQIMNLTPDSLENEIYRHSAVLYKCNVLNGTIFYSSGEDWDTQTYQKIPNWNKRKENCFGLFVDPISFTNVDMKSELGIIPDVGYSLFLPKSYGIQVLDRFQPVSGENTFYVVKNALPNSYVGSDIVLLTEDTR